MSRAEQIGADILAAPQQIPRRFLLLGRNVNRGQRARAIEHGQVARVTAVGLNAVTCAARDQGWRDHVAANTVHRQRPLQLEPTRARLVTALHRTLALDPLHESENRRRLGRQTVQRGRPLPRQQDCGDRRRGVLIKRNQRSKLHGDRPPLYAALL